MISVRGVSQVSKEVREEVRFSGFSFKAKAKIWKTMRSYKVVR